MAGRHSKVGGSGKRRIWWPFAATFIVIAVAAVFAVRWVNDVANGCGKTIELAVDADPNIAPALTEFVETELPETTGEARCVHPEIRAVEPAAVADDLAVAEGVDGPDVWIPDSTLWLRRAGALTDAVPREGTSIATSPVVLAATERAAGEAGWPERNPTWAELLGGSGVAGTPDPAGDTSAVFALLGIEGLAAWDTTERTRAMQALTKRTFTAGDDPFEHLPGGGGDPAVAAFPASEQAVLQHNAKTKANAGSEHSVVAAYPEEKATTWLEYPLVVLDDIASEQHDAGLALLKALQGTAAVKILAKHGFRDLGGKLAGPGAADKRARADAGAPPKTPNAKATNAALQRWATLSAAARMVVALDVSGSMEQAVPGTDATRMQIAVATVAEALRLLRPNTQLAFWEFSTERDGKLPYKQLAPWQPMLRHVAEGLPDKLGKMISGPAGSTGLFDTTLAAVKELQRGWDPAQLNLVLIVTDGKNEYPAGLTKRQAIKQLRKVVAPERPTRVIFVGLGTEVDNKELTDIAKATGGQVHLSPDVKQVRELFFTILRNLAPPGQEDTP